MESTKTPFDISKGSYEELFKIIPGATAIYYGTGFEIVMANEAMIKLWGKDQSVIGKKLIDALPELKGQAFMDLLAQVYSTGIPYTATEAPGELVVDGRLQKFYFDYTYQPIKNADGRIIGIVNSATDVTELVNARQRVAETEHQLTFALNAAGIGTWNLDLTNNTIIWNARCRELFGFPGNEDVKYDDAISCIHPDDREMVKAAVKVATSPDSNGHYDIKYRTVGRYNQQLRWLHCQGMAYFNEKGIAVRFAGTTFDITQEVTARRRQQQLLSLIEHNADLMAVADMNGQVIYMNRAARKLLGIPLNADVSRLNAVNFYAPDEVERMQEITAHINDEHGWQGSVKLIKYDGKTTVPCHVSYILIKDPDTGEVIGRGGTARDLRPELKAKAELQRLATIVDISEDFCNYCDIKGNTIYINQSGSKLIGIDRDKIRETTMFDYHSDESDALITKEIMPVLLTEGRWSGQLELLHQQTGEIIPIHKQLFIIREEITNDPIAIAGIARDLRPDLNARRALDDKNLALQAAVKELEFLANSIPTEVWSAKPTGELDFVSRRWLDRTTDVLEDALGTGWLKNLHPDDRQRAIDLWVHSISTGEPYQTEFRVMVKSGQYRWFLVRALPLFDENGRILKWYGNNTDIQEQKEMAEQKDNFLGIASHELKTPVTSIKAYAQVLEMMMRRDGDSKKADMMAKMNSQLDRLTGLIGNLLDVTKINTGKMTLNQQWFNFKQLANEIIEDMQTTTERHLITHEAGYEGDVYGDRDRISQVIVNLISNAIKYSPNANAIDITTMQVNDELMFCVQDYGIGISADKAGRVFEQFYRVSGDMQHTYPGLGLGLFISSEIIKREGGRIWVDTADGKGAKFCFTLSLNSNGEG